MTARDKAIAGRRSRNALRLLAAAGIAAMLAGCMERKVAEDSYPTDYRLRHPIALKEGERTVEVFLGRNRGGLTPDQRADVLAFAQVWRREAMSGIILDVPQGGPTDHAATDSLREIHSILNASGVPGKAVYVRPYRPAALNLTSIKLSYSKLVAEAGPCGQWPHDLGASADRAYNENHPYWNLGCAYQRNLAAMVDNPADLVQPRPETPSYTVRRSEAFGKYRKGETTTTTYPESDKAKLSDTGK